jgi:hypothetical protein
MQKKVIITGLAIDAHLGWLASHGTDQFWDTKDALRSFRSVLYSLLLAFPASNACTRYLRGHDEVLPPMCPWTLVFNGSRTLRKRKCGG